MVPLTIFDSKLRVMIGKLQGFDLCFQPVLFFVLPNVNDTI